MTSVLLPSSPAPVTLNWVLQDFGGVQAPDLGGPAVRVNRLGNRWAVSVQMPVMDGATARLWITRLVQAKTAGARLAVSQPGLTVGSPGTPLVDGAGQAGSSLALKGLTVGYGLQAGQWLSVVVSGRRYLYQLGDAATVDGAGKVTASISPMQRVSPPNNAAVEMAPAYVEGLLTEGDYSWTVDVAGQTGLSFTISELG